MVFGANLFTGRFRPKPLPGTALYSTTTNRSGPVLKYDDQSGNLFTEETFRSPKTLLELIERPNYNERLALYQKYRRTNFAKKENTLYNICRKIVLEQAESLTPEVLRALDWYYGKHLWEDIIHSKADSFNIFKNFCEVYGHEPDFHPGNRELCDTNTEITGTRYLGLPMTESMPWTPLYIPHLESQSAAWLLNLTITGNFEVLDLTQLNGLSNLTALKLQIPAGTNHRFLGTVFKSWVTNKDKLSALRVLQIMNYPGVVDEDGSRGLAILSSLPSLKLVQVKLAHGWTLSSKLQCRYYRRLDFVIGSKGKLRVFCDKLCSDCSSSIQKDDNLLELLQPNGSSKDTLEANVRNLATILVEKEKTFNGKRRIMVDVGPKNEVLGKQTGWIYIYKNEAIESPANASDDHDSKKRKVQDEELTENKAPLKRIKSKMFKAKSSRKQDITSLLGSFM